MLNSKAFQGINIRFLLQQMELTQICLRIKPTFKNMEKKPQIILYKYPSENVLKEKHSQRVGNVNNALQEKNIL